MESLTFSVILFSNQYILIVAIILNVFYIDHPQTYAMLEDYFNNLGIQHSLNWGSNFFNEHGIEHSKAVIELQISTVNDLIIL